MDIWITVLTTVEIENMCFESGIQAKVGTSVENANIWGPGGI